MRFECTVMNIGKTTIIIKKLNEKKNKRKQAKMRKKMEVNVLRKSETNSTK